jgi:predicted kinase
VLSTDAYIEQKCKERVITYSCGFRDFFNDARKQLSADLEKALQYKLDIIWDQTNLSHKSRAGKLSRLHPSYRKVAALFSYDETTLHQRLIRREINEGKYIPTHVLKEMKKQYEDVLLKRSELHQQFDKVIEVKHGDEESGKRRFIELWARG